MLPSNEYWAGVINLATKKRLEYFTLAITECCKTGKEIPEEWLEEIAIITASYDPET